MAMGAVMGTVISELFDESGMSVQAFADAAGLKYGTAYDIARGVSKVENIGAGAFIRIAHVFGKTADELLSDIPVDDADSYSKDERELVDLFRKCDDYQRKSILKSLREAAGDGHSFFTQMKLSGSDGMFYTTKELQVFDDMSSTDVVHSAVELKATDRNGNTLETYRLMDMGGDDE